jgi:hypothetical protein
MNTDKVVSIPVKLDKVTFRHFAVFDTFRRQKRWQLPIWFAVILAGISVILFFQTDRPQSGLLGGVFLAVGLGFPAVYFISFFSTLRENIIKYCLPRQVYTVQLRDKDVHIASMINQNEELTLPWDTLHMAYRVKSAVYLYVLRGRAFLLPDGQADVPDDELWAFLQEKMPKGRCRNLRKDRGR